MPSTPPDALTPSVSRQNTSAIVEDCKKRERGWRPPWRLDSNSSISDPRGTVNFEYDVLHRLTRKRHETTVVAEYTYDGTAANNAIGRLITDTDGAAGSGADKSDYTYDPMGRIRSEERRVGKERRDWRWRDEVRESRKEKSLIRTRDKVRSRSIESGTAQE